MSKVGKGTSDPRGPRARRIIPILVPRYGGIVVYWYLGVEVYRYFGTLESSKTLLKCSKFRKAPARRLANGVASESTPQEKKEGGESERGEIWDSIPASWRQNAQKIASVGQIIAQKGLSKNTQKICLKKVSKKGPNGGK